MPYSAQTVLGAGSGSPRGGTLRVGEVGAPHGVVLPLCPHAGKCPAAELGWVWERKLSLQLPKTEQGTAVKNSWADRGRLLPPWSMSPEKSRVVVFQTPSGVLAGDGEPHGCLAVSASLSLCAWRRARGGVCHSCSAILVS